MQVSPFAHFLRNQTWSTLLKIFDLSITFHQCRNWSWASCFNQTNNFMNNLNIHHLAKIAKIWIAKWEHERKTSKTSAKQPREIVKVVCDNNGIHFKLHLLLLGKCDKIFPRKDGRGFANVPVKRVLLSRKKNNTRPWWMHMITELSPDSNQITSLFAIATR